MNHFIQDHLNEINSLKSQVEDKEAIIAELSKHLENKSVPSTRRRGKHVAAGNDGATDHEEILREMEELRRKVKKNTTKTPLVYGDIGFL